MTQPVVLIVEDDARFRRSLTLELGDRGYAVLAAGSLAEAVTCLDGAAPVAAVVDMRLGADSGLAVVAAIAARHPACRTVVLTGYASIATAVLAVKAGAAEYLTKPVSIDVLERALWTDAPPADDAPLESLARREREYLEWVLASCDGNVTLAARRLGIHRQSLQRKLRKHPPP